MKEYIKEAESEENHEVENNSEGSLEDKDGKPSESEPTEAPDSNEDSNDDEEEYTIYTKFSCLSELKARGWDKYIPAKLPDDKK